MTSKVTSVIDGDTFDINPGWEWNDADGNRVRIANYDAAEMDARGGQSAKQKLTNLISGKQVELKNPVSISYGRVVCDVYLDGSNITTLLK